MVEPSRFNYPMWLGCACLPEEAKLLTTAGTGRVRFARSKGTAVEAMVPEPEPCAGNPESRCGEVSVGTRARVDATKTRRGVDRTEQKQYLSNGIVGLEDLASFQLVPPAERLREKRPVAMIECIQEIPCNSCVVACKLGAIQMARINDIPRVDYDKCTGCMACAMVCPGLAAFLVREGDGVGYVTMPYEFLPVPKAGDQVTTLNRKGTVLGKSKVARVLPPERNDGTALVTIEVPREWVLEARAIKASV